MKSNTDNINEEVIMYVYNGSNNQYEEEEM